MSEAAFHHSLAQQMYLESPQSAEASPRDKVIPREGAVRDADVAIELGIWQGSYPENRPSTNQVL